jgi:hypothetical protein
MKKAVLVLLICWVAPGMPGCGPEDVYEDLTLSLDPRDLPDGISMIKYYVLPNIVEDRESRTCTDDDNGDIECQQHDALMVCESGLCKYNLTCFDFFGDSAKNVYDFSYAFALTPEEVDIDENDPSRIDLVIKDIPEGRMLFYIEAYVGQQLRAAGCGTGQIIAGKKISLRIVLQAEGEGT